MYFSKVISDPYTYNTYIHVKTAYLYKRFIIKRSKDFASSLFRFIIKKAIFYSVVHSVRMYIPIVFTDIYKFSSFHLQWKILPLSFIWPFYSAFN